jgi:hypothetical protein
MCRMLAFALSLAVVAGAIAQEAGFGRSAIEKDKLLKTYGGNPQSEAAVARGLAWLAKQQKDDGHWEFDGSSRDKVAATGMALLPFLAAGEAHKEAKKYQKTVAAGVAWLMRQDKSEQLPQTDRERFTDKPKTVRGFGTNNMYAHALATIALCEAAGRAKDEKVKEKAEAAVKYVINAQGRNGSWGYTGPRPSEGDTSIVGWQIQALAVAKFAGIKVDGQEKALENADKFLQSVSTDDGSKYGYREKGASQTLTPSGLLSRLSIGTFKPADGAVAKGVEFLRQFPPQKNYFDMYYYYYATRVIYLHGEADWHKFWNPKMRDLMIELQKQDGDAMGSWDKDQGFIGASCGKLGTTAMALLTLEVYYRYPPPALPKGFELPEK